MNMKTLSPGQFGLLKGSLVTATLFSTGIGIGLFFLHRKHEAELDKLEKDTAMTCLDFAAEHYEGVIRRSKQATAGMVATAKQPITKMTYYEEFLEYQRRLDNAVKAEPTEEERATLKQKMILQQKEYEELLQKIGEQKAQSDIGIDELKLKLLSKKATELADKALHHRDKTPEEETEAFQREIDAMNNYEDTEE